MKDDDTNPDKDPMATMAEALGAMMLEAKAPPKLVKLTQIGKFVMKAPEGDLSAHPFAVGGRGELTLEAQKPHARAIPATYLTDMEESEGGQTILRFGFEGKILVQESIEEIQIKGSLAIS
jgi:hypothetical protein